MYFNICIISIIAMGFAGVCSTLQGWWVADMCFWIAAALLESVAMGRVLRVNGIVPALVGLLVIPIQLLNAHTAYTRYKQDKMRS